jgi:DTW domain-containing protein YfiP
LNSKLIAPDDTRLFVEDFARDKQVLNQVLQRYPDPSRILLLFPSIDSVELDSLPRSSFDRLVVIDGTWRQAKSMCWALVPFGFRAVRIGGDSLPRTLFWRHQEFGEHCLATIEAIYWFYREFEDVYGGSGSIHVYDSESNNKNDINTTSSNCNKNSISNMGVSTSNRNLTCSQSARRSRSGGSRFDQLLFYFKYQYELIQRTYKESGKPFTARKHDAASYIKT